MGWEKRVVSILPNGSNLYIFQHSFAELAISAQCWNSCNTAGLWSDLRKGLSGVSFECFPSVYHFSVFWPPLQCHSSEKRWSSRQENITKVNTTNKAPTKTSENNQDFFLFSFDCCSCLKRTTSFLEKKQINMTRLNTVNYFVYTSSKIIFLHQLKTALCVDVSCIRTGLAP